MTMSDEWRIFLSYRREDGLHIAEWLHRRLNGTALRDDRSVRLRTYYDRAAPSAGDFRTILRPYLKSSKAFVFVATPLASQRRSSTDFLFDELDWWTTKRRTPPIVIESFRRTNQ